MLEEIENTHLSKAVNDLRDSEIALDALQRVNNGLRSELSCAIAHMTSKLQFTESTLKVSQENLSKLRKDASKLRKNLKRTGESKKRALAALKKKILKERSTYHLMHKGVITEEIRNVVRTLVNAGCSRKYIPDVITTVLKSAGIKSVGSISRPSIGCIIHEGYFAAQMQLGYEIKNATSLTLSADGTSHRSINYNSRHIHLDVEDYNSENNATCTKRQHVTHTLGIQSSQDGSSEEAMADWKKTFENISEHYNNSPLGQKSGGFLSFIGILIKVTAMNTDHCAKEKKDARLFCELKKWAVNQHLGEEKMLGMTFEEIQEHFAEAEIKMIEKAGGVQKWNRLSDPQKAERKVAMLEEVVADMGREIFETLPEKEKRLFRLFLWVGCGCHKDFNTVRGGYAAILCFWQELDEEEAGGPKPILLANKDNAPVLEDRSAVLEEGNVPTSAQE